MISRRLVRIKAMQTYYAFLQDDEEQNIDNLVKEMERNINHSYQLFIHLHCLLIAIFDFAADKLELAKNKHVKTDDDINPNTKFCNNRIISAFLNDVHIKNAMSNSNLNWSEYPEFVKAIWQDISKSTYYSSFMTNPEDSFNQDFEIIKKIISKNITDNPQLDEILEEKSIYWNDDLEFLCSNLIQNIKNYSKNISDYKLPELFKDNQDKNFAYTLIKQTALNKDNFDKKILNCLKKWELERIAFLDRVILHLALGEITQIPYIPVKVTINEYLDIAKFYSTEKSCTFINGIIDKIHIDLKKSGELNKTGTGLL